ncbi:MAG: hypothetical protein WCJ64_22670 [Rhodospirillaceae bacterium]
MSEGSLESYRLAVAVTLVASAAVAAAIAMHPPSAFHDDRLDQRRGEDLSRLSSEITTYRRSRHDLPPDLATLAAAQAVYPAILRDPGSGELYRYRYLSPVSYRLCAPAVHPALIRERFRWTQVESDQGWSCFLYFITPAGR